MNKELLELDNFFRKFPGIGPKTARRYSKEYIELSDKEKKHYINVLNKFVGNSSKCNVCGNYTLDEKCDICTDVNRNHELLCIVEKIEDIEVIETSKVFDGLYFVTGGLFSFAKSKSQKEINFQKLFSRLKKENIVEIIFSFKFCIESQVTIDFIVENIKKMNKNIKFSTLNFGIPTGTDISLMDPTSVAESIKFRRNYSEK